MAKLQHDHQDGKQRAGTALEGILGAQQKPPEDKPEPALPKFEMFDQLVTQLPPEPPLLVGGTDPANPHKNALIHQGDKVMLGAESKAGKTWWLMQKSLCIAAGIPFLGHTTAQGWVLYCNFELRPWAFARRIKRIAEKLDLLDGAGRMKKTTQFLAWNLRGKCYDIEKICTVAEERLSRMNGLKLAAIVVDPLYKSYGDKEENNATDMTAVLGVMEKFAEKFNAAIFIASHFAKGDSASKSQIDRISGSGVIARDPDSIMTLSRIKEEKNVYALEATLRNMASPEPVAVEFDFPVWKLREDVSPAGKGYDLQAMVDLLPPDGMSSNKWFEAIAEQGLGGNKKRLQDLKDEAIKKGLIKVTEGPRNAQILTKI